MKRIKMFYEKKLNLILDYLNSLSNYENIAVTKNIIGENGNDVFEESNEVTVNVTYDDILEYQESEYGKECTKSLLANKHLNDIYNFLIEQNAGFIAINRYSYGSDISFRLNKHEHAYDNLTIFTDNSGEFNYTKLIIGEEYYLGQTKYEHFQGNILPDITKSKLLDIKFSPNLTNYNYTLIFDNIEPIAVFSSGITYSNNSVEHRVDYIVIEKNKMLFIKKMIAKISSELGSENDDRYYNILEKIRSYVI
jgi:hypothetical protein